MDTLEHLGTSISSTVRQLRKKRRWTQAELARHLGLSQPRLSQIEQGGGSFTAEQFLTILKLFNVFASDFVPQQEQSDHAAELQNALARLGAAHLQERQDILLSERLRDVNHIVHETLLSGVPRLITGLAPVIVNHVDLLSLERIDARLAEGGLERRLRWLVQNVLDALVCELSELSSRQWGKRYRRTKLILETYLARFGLAFVTPGHCVDDEPIADVLDREIRTSRTLDEVKATSSPISKRWGIVTRLQPRDFADALRSSRDAD